MTKTLQDAWTMIQFDKDVVALLFEIFLMIADSERFATGVFGSDAVLSFDRFLGSESKGHGVDRMINEGVNTVSCVFVEW